MQPILTPERRQLWSRWRPTLKYMAETEAHVYALAVAASVLLAFYPFLIVMLSLCRNVFHSSAAVSAINLALNDLFPGELGAFIVRNLHPNGKVEYVSLFLLLFTANGVFEPMEVALNRAWGVTTNRSYLKNQLVSLGLIFACGALALLSVMLTAANRDWIASITGGHSNVAMWINLLIFKLAAIPISILSLFLVYWLLPNRPVPPARVAPVAILVGLILEGLKYVNMLLLPMMQPKLMREYGVFHNSVTLLLLSFLSALIVLAGAEWTARHDPSNAAADPLS